MPSLDLHAADPGLIAAVAVESREIEHARAALE